MSCPRTQHLLKEYFSDELSMITKEKIEAHVAACEYCRAELSDILGAKKVLEGWQQQKVPHWDRGSELFRREYGKTDQHLTFWEKIRWQLMPTTASLLMLLLFLFNIQLSSDQDGFTVSFGPSAVSTFYLENELQILDEMQAAELEGAIRELEVRQDSQNMELLQAVIYQNQQDTLTSLERIYNLFEEQRLRDLEDMRIGYQQLMDSDYETLRSLRQLAQFVSYQEQGF
ncbi:MAG: hypothetical protein CMQ30_04515 [Gammaproteobacteria bacterium]|nr:hypothetical protein [Gammaproteobacteria bacterium]